MNLQIWKSETQKIFWSIIALVIIGFLYGLMPLVDPVAAAKGAVGYSMPWYCYVFPIIMAGVYVFMFLSANKIASILKAEDAKSFKFISYSFCIYAVSNLMALIPSAGSIISTIFGICAIVLFIMAFKGLKESASMPELVHSGANMLFIGYILALVAAVLSFIPTAGPILAFIIALVVFVLEIIGWVRFMKAEPEL